MKKTKQGVRDLNSLPSKPAGVRLEPPPEQEEPSERYVDGNRTRGKARDYPGSEGGLR